MLIESFYAFQEFSLAVGESIPVLIQFDPSYKDDFVTRTAESQLEVAFKEHPEKVINQLFECYFRPPEIHNCRTFQARELWS